MYTIAKYAIVPCHSQIWERLVPQEADIKVPTHLSRSDYLEAFAPSSSNPLSALCGYGAGPGPGSGAAARAAGQGMAGGSGVAGGGGGAGGSGSAQRVVTLAQLSAACKAAFVSRMAALFERHTVCTLENVRAWLLEPRHATSECGVSALQCSSIAVCAQPISLSVVGSHGSGA
jgi:hypothetical protein